jgi:Rnl2 family RNA ligase
MGYLSIDNLYKNKTILMFKECYAMEKIHGTSAHISFTVDEKTLKTNVIFFSGGEKFENFVKLFDKEDLWKRYICGFGKNVTIYGEAYGGKQQKMSDTYGKELKFVAFEVKIEDNFLAVPEAEQIVKYFGLEFVHYELVPTDIEILDRLAEAPSVQAKRNGILEDKIREGIVLRPLIELRKNNGERIIAKHKNAKFQERQHQPKLDQTEFEVLTETNKIVDEWVTEMRLSHILGKLQTYSIKDTGDICRLMTEDIRKEANGEMIENADLRRAVGKKTAEMFKRRLRDG